MPKSKSSRRWLKEHHGDVYVQRAKAEGYRSRAVFKLMEINERDRLLKPGMTVVDLGAAPGGWSQYAARAVGRSGRVIALDILAIDPLSNVEIIQGDFREEAVLHELIARAGERGADLVISDMAPNTSGIDAVDQPRAMYLAELALDLAGQVLKPGGSLLVKLFQGVGFDEFVRECRRRFGRVVTRKPKASRARSREVYLLAQNCKL